MAKKQIIQLGIKFLDPVEIAGNRYNIQRKPGDIRRPFWSIFVRKYQHLPLEVREKIIDILDPCEKSNMEIIKQTLKKYFLGKAYPVGEPPH